MAVFLGSIESMASGGIFPTPDALAFASQGIFVGYDDDGPVGVPVFGTFDIIPGYLYKGADLRIRFRGARDIDNNYINDGTCTYTITKDSDGSVLSTGTMDYVISSNGNYWCTIDKTETVNVVPDEFYTLEMNFTDPRGCDDRRYRHVAGAERRTV